uniref:Nephrocystin 4 n=1 Tax=Neogobius melanostomus TaxID=47308 RepID=A0A8C6UFG7_9GOBI
SVMFQILFKASLGLGNSVTYDSKRNCFADHGVLRAVEGAHLDCALKSHSPLASALHLFPENVLLSGDESIPGLLDSPTGGALLKPRLLPSLAFTLSSVIVSLRPSLESFEAELLQCVNDPLRMVVIQERRLHVGVHNGWGFLESPQVVVLEVLSSAGSEDKTSPPQKLGLRSSLQLTLINHPAVAIVFQLEYVFSAPIGRETVVSDGDKDVFEIITCKKHNASLLITPLPSSSLCAVSSRRSLARLRSAGFPDVLDCTGQPAEELDPSQPVTFDPQREENDPLQGNHLLLQFLAFTRVPGEGVAPDWPLGVYFTFQLYRFPPVTTQPLALLTDQSQPPLVFSAVDSPGLQLQFRVDRSFLRPGEQRCFLRYLALHSLHVDVWDSHSLLLLGSTALPLKHLLRQGKPAVQTLHELDVLTTDYVGEGPLGTSGDQDCSLTVHTVLRGRLHVRTGNIGERRPHTHVHLRPRMTKPASVPKPDGVSAVLWQDSAASVSGPGVERGKAEGITHMLSQAITQQHLLFSALGSAEYLEYVLRNPFNTAHTVTICSDHPDLSVITSAAEWRYFKSLNPTATAVEENMFHLEPGSLHIPLKYQSFQCEHSMSSSCLRPLDSQVTFSTEDGKPLSILQVNVQPTPHAVDQTFRLYHPEQSFLKKAIRLAPWDLHAGAELGDPPPVTVRCTDPNVVCQTRKTLPGEPQDVYLKVPGGPSPHVRVFSIMVYTDKWTAAPSQVWQVYVHFLERVDMSVVSGQRSCQSLVLRGKQNMRKLRCYCSHTRDLQVEPGGVFALPPAAVQEVQVKVQPWRTGRRFFYLSAVDVEQQRLVSSWLLCLTVHRPVVSKAFEVSVPVGEGRGSSRKISYTNPYSGPRSLLLRSDHPHLLQFREERFQIGGGETYTIGLRFAPSTRPGAVEILVYVNDQDERTEEAFCVKVNYS